MAEKPIELEVHGRAVKVTNPSKVFFSGAGYTKLDVVNYFLAVAEGALNGCRRRPMVLKRYVDGADKEPFFQKRAPKERPSWIPTAHITFPSGRTADLAVLNEPASLAWAANLGCVDLNPWPVRDDDVDHPDELRVDLDPTPEATFGHVREVAMAVREVLAELGYEGYPKTSGSRGIHINVRIEPNWGFSEVRRCALALGREVERRIPALATTAWWKEERHGVFIDYNQNARDRTVASAYSVRPTPDARVSYPLRWGQVPDVDPAAYTLATVPALFQRDGDAAAGIDDVHHSLEPLLELVQRHEREGMGEAPYPPQFPKAEGEPLRVQPSRKAKPKDGRPTRTTRGSGKRRT
jgi:DNA ligase D-like protein (predicted polymerase)